MPIGRWEKPKTQLRFEVEMDPTFYKLFSIILSVYLDNLHKMEYQIVLTHCADIPRIPLCGKFEMIWHQYPRVSRAHHFNHGGSMFTFLAAHRAVTYQTSFPGKETSLFSHVIYI
jgi:hypothetical protein